MGARTGPAWTPGGLGLPSGGESVLAVAELPTPLLPPQNPRGPPSEGKMAWPCPLQRRLESLPGQQSGVRRGGAHPQGEQRRRGRGGWGAGGVEGGRGEGRVLFSFPLGTDILLAQR